MKLQHTKFGRCGSATLELALTLMILCWITFGTVQFGQYFYLKNQIQGAAREGARAGITQGATSSDVTTAVGNVMTLAGIPSSKYTVTQSGVSGATGTQVQVQVKCVWGQVSGGFNVMPGLDMSAKQIIGTATMRKE